MTSGTDPHDEYSKSEGRGAADGGQLRQAAGVAESIIVCQHTEAGLGAEYAVD